MSEPETRDGDDGAVLRSIAKSIRPAFPEAADLLLGIERMHWPTEAHRQHEAAAAARAEVAALRGAVEAVRAKLPHGLPDGIEDAYQRGYAHASDDIARRLDAALSPVSSSGEAEGGEGGDHLDRVSVLVEPCWTSRRRLDPANLAPTAKACLDGLTDAGVWVDDDSEHVVAVTFARGPRVTGVARLRLTITELDPTLEDR